MLACGGNTASGNTASVHGLFALEAEARVELLRGHVGRVLPTPNPNNNNTECHRETR